MIKIKLSYSTTEEMEEVLRLLHPLVKRCSVKAAKEGKYKRLYIQEKKRK